MYIKLPKKFNMDSSTTKNAAFIQNKVLKIRRGTTLREVMYEITFRKYGRRCFYCGKVFPKDKITIDHIFPQDFGGPTITDNLVPACKQCNTEKSNMTKNQFMSYIEARKHGKGKEFRKEFNKKIKYGKYKIPGNWITKRKITEITVVFDLKEKYQKDKMRTIKYFYNTYGILKKPIVIDKNGFLLDGFMILMFAKTKGIEEISVIVLDNVEVI